MMAAPEDEFIKRYFRTANPNPNRIGCPSREVLRAVARKSGDVPEEVFGHLIKCSECLLDIDSLRASRRRRTLWAGGGLLAAAALAILIITVAIPSNRSSSGQIATWNIASVTRNADSTSMPALSAGRRRGIIAVNLPYGSEPGHYEIQIRASEDAPALRSYHGDAKVSDDKTTLTFVVDFRNLAAGLYTLAYRHDEGAWHTAPLVIN